MDINNKWMYNATRAENWNGDYYDTHKQAIAAGRKEYPNQNFYIGQCERIDIPIEVNSEGVIERIAEVIDDNYNIEFDFGDIFYNEAMEHHDELQKSLEKVVTEWLNKHQFCEDRFVIRDTELVEIKMTKKTNKEIKCPTCANYDQQGKKCNMKVPMQGKCRLYFERQGKGTVK